MKTPLRFREYIWLVNTIRRARKITFAEIQKKWLDSELSEGVELSRSTFNRHKEAIQDMFGIYIECDRQNGYKYSIGNSEVLQNDSVQNWLLSTLSVSNVISESISLQDRILLEAIPTADTYLGKVIEAMKKNVRIAIEYRRYGTDTPKQLNFEPYCIKLCKRRWYVLGHFYREATGYKPEADYFGIFSFDRILSMHLTDTKFKINPDFDAQEFFNECYGVFVNDDTELEKIVIRAYNHERYYLRDLPLHKSQNEIGQGEDYADFELFVRPTVDFCDQLMSRGCLIRVLSPQWLAEEIYHMHLDAAQMYEHNDTSPR